MIFSFRFHEASVPWFRGLIRLSHFHGKPRLCSGWLVVTSMERTATAGRRAVNLQLRLQLPSCSMENLWISAKLGNPMEYHLECWYPDISCVCWIYGNQTTSAPHGVFFVSNTGLQGPTASTTFCCNMLRNMMQYASICFKRLQTNHFWWATGIMQAAKNTGGRRPMAWCMTRFCRPRLCSRSLAGLSGRPGVCHPEVTHDIRMFLRTK